MARKIGFFIFENRFKFVVLSIQILVKSIVNGNSFRLRTIEIHVLNRIGEILENLIGLSRPILGGCTTPKGDGNALSSTIDAHGIDEAVVFIVTYDHVR